MKPYMPKQPKHQRERVEAKLDERLVRRLEKYCQYLDSDRDYILSQALEIAFRKDKGFTEWLAAQAPSQPTPVKPREKQV
jgi:hypothetical protein